MTRWIIRAVVAMCVAAVCGLAAQEPVFRGVTEVVRVFVTVTDREGRLVTTLTQNDFQIRDEGKAQPITLFDNTPQPVRLVVMIDVSGSMQGNLPLLRGAAEQLFAKLRPDDEARVGTFGRAVSISPTFTNNADALRRALPDDIEPDAPTPLWRAVSVAMDAFGDAGSDTSAGSADRPGLRTADRPGLRTADRPGPRTEDGTRSVVLVLSDGKDSGPLDFRERYISQADVIDRARREDVMVYGIGMRSRGPRPTVPGIGPGALQAALMADMPDAGLAMVAEQTGGGYAEIRFGQDLGAAFARVADELHSQYLLGFAPPKRDGKVHDIDVKVTGSGLKPRARKSYLAPK